MGRKALSRKPEPKRGIAWPRWTGFRGMTLRNWLELLVVPLALVVLGFLFSVQQDARQQRIEDQRAEAERELAEQRAQDEALQAYLDQMAQLLTDKEHPLHEAQPGDSLSTVARARTLTVLGRLDSGRKRSVLEFLYESRLIAQEQTLLDEDGLIERRHNIVSLGQADLRGVYLSWSYLRGADLSWSYLREADLRGAYLREADLSSAHLYRADLRAADLRGADLRKAKGVTNEQLSAASSLEGATMPDGQTLRGDETPNGPTFEDWLREHE